MPNLYTRTTLAVTFKVEAVPWECPCKKTAKVPPQMQVSRECLSCHEVQIVTSGTGSTAKINPVVLATKASTLSYVEFNKQAHAVVTNDLGTVDVWKASSQLVIVSDRLPLLLEFLPLIKGPSVKYDFDNFDVSDFVALVLKQKRLHSPHGRGFKNILFVCAGPPSNDDILSTEACTSNEIGSDDATKGGEDYDFKLGAPVSAWAWRVSETIGQATHRDVEDAKSPLLKVLSVLMAALDEGGKLDILADGISPASKQRNQTLSDLKVPVAASFEPINSSTLSKGWGWKLQTDGRNAGIRSLYFCDKLPVAYTEPTKMKDEVVDDGKRMIDIRKLNQTAYCSILVSPSLSNVHYLDINGQQSFSILSGVGTDNDGGDASQVMTLNESKRVLVVYSQHVPHLFDFTSMLLPTAAKVQYDFATTTPRQLVKTIKEQVRLHSRAGQGFDCVAFACHGPPSECTFSWDWGAAPRNSAKTGQVNNGSAAQKILTALSESVLPGGVVDVLCFKASMTTRTGTSSGDNGRRVFAELSRYFSRVEAATGVAFGAFDCFDANPSHDDNDIDAFTNCKGDSIRDRYFRTLDEGPYFGHHCSAQQPSQQQLSVAGMQPNHGYVVATPGDTYYLDINGMQLSVSNDILKSTSRCLVRRSQRRMVRVWGQFIFYSILDTLDEIITLLSVAATVLMFPIPLPRTHFMHPSFLLSFFLRSFVPRAFLTSTSSWHLSRRGSLRTTLTPPPTLIFRPSWTNKRRNFLRTVKGSTASLSFATPEVGWSS
jgi:hypothetical protein